MERNIQHSETSSDSEDNEESQEEKTLSPCIKNFEDRIDLDNFRQLWQEEIKSSAATERDAVSNMPSSSLQRSESKNDKIDEQARYWFLCGVQAEKNGLFERAISFYRKAIQLVPDIEFRITETLRNHSNESPVEVSDNNSVPEEKYVCDDERENLELCNLSERFQNIALKCGTTCICFAEREQKTSHISILPPEIFMHILKWVVSEDLDLLSLEQVSKVCRGFYLCAKDSEIWRLACLRIWDTNTGNLNHYGSWRSMYIQRPHLSYNGAYISKTTYFRYGEPSFQDTFYRPWYLVEYYRYLRFFPKGLVLMLTTPDDPYQSLSKLQHSSMKHKNILYGHYKLIGDTVMAVVKKPKTETAAPSGAKYYANRRQRQANLHETCDQTFHLELAIRTIKGRYNCQLSWIRYSIHVKYNNGHEAVSDFDLSPSKYPPFWFSRVRSFSSEALNVLK